MNQPGVDRGSRLAARRKSGARRGVGGEGGSATVVGLGAVLALLSVFVLAVQLGAATVTRHRTEAAADLAALAAAAHAVSGNGVACDSARRVTDRMAVRLVVCELRGWDAHIEAEGSPPGLLGGFGTARATARAGPVRPTTVVAATDDGLNDERSFARGERRNSRPACDQTAF